MCDTTVLWRTVHQIPEYQVGLISEEFPSLQGFYQP